MEGVPWDPGPCVMEGMPSNPGDPGTLGPLAEKIFTVLQKRFTHVPEEELKVQACEVAHSKEDIWKKIVWELNQRNENKKPDVNEMMEERPVTGLSVAGKIFTALQRRFPHVPEEELNQRHENENPDPNFGDEMMEERPVVALRKRFPHVMEGIPWDPGPSVMEGMPSDPGPSVLIDKTSHPNPAWRAIYKLEFGAKPEKRNRKEWICSLECKKKNNEVVTFKDAQATEKHIMREHPDPMYNKFVCLKDGCKKEKASPQQILDHLGQKEEKGGHRITTKIEKDENLRAVKSTGEKYRVLRDKASFAWYICVPNQPSPPDSRTPSPTDPNHSVASLNTLPESSEVHSNSSRSSSSSALPVSECTSTGSDTCSSDATTSDLVEQKSNCQNSEVPLPGHLFASPG